MADTQEDDLPQATTLNSADFLRIVADLAGTPVSKVLSRANLKVYTDTLYEPIGGGGTGWQTVTETWTRTGNHTFTVSTDLTTKYRKETKVRYKDGGAYEYGVIGSSSYGSPNTTITLITNTNYAMAAGTITDTAISYQSGPQGFPDGFDFDAAPLGFSVVPSSPVYRWHTIGGGLVALQYDEPNNGTSNATTFTASAPIAAKNITGAIWGSVLWTTVDNNTTQTTPGRMFISAASTLITFRKDTANAWTGSSNKRTTGYLVYEF